MARRYLLMMFVSFLAPLTANSQAVPVPRDLQLPRELLGNMTVKDALQDGSIMLVAKDTVGQQRIPILGCRIELPIDQGIAIDVRNRLIELTTVFASDISIEDNTLESTFRMAQFPRSSIKTTLLAWYRDNRRVIAGTSTRINSLPIDSDVIYVCYSGSSLTPYFLLEVLERTPDTNVLWILF